MNSEKAMVQVDFQKFQSKVESDLDKLKDEFTVLFCQMKKLFTQAIGNLKQEIYNQELIQNFGATVTPNQVNLIVDQKLASSQTTTSLNYNEIERRVKRLVGDSINDVF